MAIRGRPYLSLLAAGAFVVLLFHAFQLPYASSTMKPPPSVYIKQSRDGGSVPAPFVGAPSNFTLVFMWNFKIDEGRRVFLNRVYGPFFARVHHIGGDDACNTGFVGVTHAKTRVAQYVCFGELMAQEPGAFGTLGFLFLADDVAICPTEMIAELSDNPRVPRYAGSDFLRQADALILEHVRDGPNSTFFAAGTSYTKWVWADQFPTVKRALLDSDKILSQRTKRQISARLGDRCARAATKSVNNGPQLTLLQGRRGRGVDCLPRPGGGNSDVVYMPRGESALSFAKHARAIKETGISTEIALPIIMYTLPNPPGHFADRGRMKFLWGVNRREAARYIGGNASASSTVACSGGGIRCRLKSPRAGEEHHYVKDDGPLPTNKFGCACLFVHPLKLSDTHNKETLAAFLNRQHELFVGGT